MLITTLLHPAGPGRPVVVTRADLTRLIGAAAARLPELAGLLVADDLDAALAVLNRADTAVLITGAPPAPQGRARLAAALQARPGRVGVLLGGWTPEGELAHRPGRPRPDPAVRPDLAG